MIERDIPAVGHDAVDEFDLARFEHHGAVAFVELLQYFFRVPGKQFVQPVIFVQRDDAQPPARAAKVFAVGVHADGVVRKRAEQ